MDIISVSITAKRRNGTCGRRRRNRTRGRKRVSYAVVNGQTGKAAADLPVDRKKYLIGSCVLAVPLFFLLNLLLTITPGNFLYRNLRDVISRGRMGGGQMVVFAVLVMNRKFQYTRPNAVYTHQTKTYDPVSSGGGSSGGGSSGGGGGGGHSF